MDNHNSKTCIVLFSGGLDSMLAIKIMQKKGFKVTAVFFKLPFIKEKSKKIKEFCKKNSCELKIFDCNKGKLLKEYLNILRKPFFNRGKGYNPCIDCKIFIFKRTKIFADKKNISLIVTGDVLDERPLSQNKKALLQIEKEADLKERILRPLSAKNLEQIKALKKTNLKNKDFYDIQGRRREKQIKLAGYFNIDYPNPSGGCLLCEPQLKKRFKELLKRNIDENKIKFLTIGRHFIIDNSWIIIGRNEKENKIIEKFRDKKRIIVPNYPAPSGIILDNYKQESKKILQKIIKAYSKKSTQKEKKEFEEKKL